MTHRTVEAQTPDGTGKMNMNSGAQEGRERYDFERQVIREDMNKQLLQKLAQVLGWSRYA